MDGAAQRSASERVARHHAALAMGWFRTPRSEQLAEFVDRQACISDDTGHGNGIDGVVPWNCNLAYAIGHNNVLTLAEDSELGLF